MVLLGTFRVIPGYRCTSKRAQRQLPSISSPIHCLLLPDISALCSRSHWWRRYTLRYGSHKHTFFANHRQTLSHCGYDVLSSTWRKALADVHAGLGWRSNCSIPPPALLSNVSYFVASVVTELKRMDRSSCLKKCSEFSSKRQHLKTFLLHFLYYARLSPSFVFILRTALWYLLY